MLTPRQRNQIKAALTFWNAVAETSRVHPMEHPKVQPYFREGDLSSLTAEEIDDLIIFFCESYEPESLVTIPYMTRSLGWGISVARLIAQAKRDNIQPVQYVSGCHNSLYRPSELLVSARRIMKRDAQMEQKYRAKTKPPPASGDKSG